MDEIFSADTLNLASNLVNWNVYHSDVFDFEKGRFKGHFRSRMGTVAGVLTYAFVMIQN